MNPMPEFPGAVRVAFASSQRTPHIPRWTELAVFYDPNPNPPGRPWIIVVRGCSTHPGESLREDVARVGTLDRGLKRFDPLSQVGQSAILQAEEWAETEWIKHAPGQLSFGSDEAALRWLYGEEVDAVKPPTLLARDFGAGESTVRAAIRAKRPVKVPFAKVAPFIDRAAFRRWREGQGNG